MATIPRWLLGRNSAFAMTLLNPDSAGVLQVYENQWSMVGQLEEVDLDSEVTHEDISPMDIRTANNVIIVDGFGVRLVEVLKTNAVNVLARFDSVADYTYMIFARGVSTWAGYFVRGPYNEGVRRGKSIGTMTIHRCNIIGAANPLYYESSDPIFNGNPSQNPQGYGIPSLSYLLGA